MNCARHVVFRFAAGMQIEVQIEERYPETLSLAPRCKGEYMKMNTEEAEGNSFQPLAYETDADISVKSLRCYLSRFMIKHASTSN